MKTGLITSEVKSHGQLFARFLAVTAIVTVALFCLLWKNGEVVYLALILALLVGLAGYLILPTKKFLEAQQAEQAEGKRILQSVLNSIAEAVVVFKTDGTLMLENPAAISLFSAGTVGTHFTEWNKAVGLYDPATSLPLSLEQTPIALALPGELDGKLMILRKVRPAPDLYVTVAGQPMLDERGRHQGAVISFHDVSEQVRSEMELRRAKAAAEAASRSKSEFLANISHEIRTPMTAVLGYADMLLVPTLTPEQRRRNVQIIRRNGRMLMQLIEDLLDISKIEAGRTDMEKETVRLQEVISEVYSLLHCRAQEQKISLVVAFEGGLPEEIFTAPVRLRQILINVLGNAIKFTETGEVKLVIRYRRGEVAKSGLLEFVVSDTGCGIAPESIGKLFSPFVQADNTTTRRYGGSGLGLALARRLARALGGDLTLERSEPGVGSTFVASLDPGPIDPSDLKYHLSMKEVLSVPVEFGRIPTSGLEGIKVLVVEDSPENRDLFVCYLAAAGAEVSTANDGKQGLDKTLKETFDVVLMDIQMPGMDGYEAVATLRGRNYSAPVIALTAHAMEDERKRCVSAGFEGFLTKPIEPLLLVETVRKMAHAAAEVLDKERITTSSPAVRSIFARFVHNIPGEIEEIKRAARANDWERVMSLAHRFQGTAGNCGFPRLMDKASKLQDTVRARKPNDALVAELNSLETLGELSAREFERLEPREM